MAWPQCERDLAMAKKAYQDSMDELDRISQEIHSARMEKKRQAEAQKQLQLEEAAAAAAAAAAARSPC